MPGRIAPDDRPVAKWLLWSIVAVILTLVVGGATRLTESGLSITEWQPVSGVVPPMTEQGWNKAYEAYLAIPEAQTVHRGITLAQFKSLYWWEWLHRILGRVTGLVLAVPYLILLARGGIERRYRLRLALLPILTGAQGALGWYMVSSGLSGRTDVSQYRLVAHLLLALVILMIALWHYLLMRVPATDEGAEPAQAYGADAALTGDRTGAGRGDRVILGVVGLVFLTIASGGFVAGLDAGRIYNTFPLMGSGLVPPGYMQLDPWWKNWFENPAAAQFNHRVLAMATFVLTLFAWVRVARSAGAGAGSRQRVRRAMTVASAAAVIQLVLGVMTLVMGVPILIAALHQLGAVTLLIALMWAARESMAINVPSPIARAEASQPLGSSSSRVTVAAMRGE
ncbi:MAG: COX15/CtaA family protein [Gemmatimonadota bacterium]